MFIIVSCTPRANPSLRIESRIDVAVDRAELAWRRKCTIWNPISDATHQVLITGIRKLKEKKNENNHLALGKVCIFVVCIGFSSNSEFAFTIRIILKSTCRLSLCRWYRATFHCTDGSVATLLNTGFGTTQKMMALRENAPSELSRFKWAYACHLSNKISPQPVLFSTMAYRSNRPETTIQGHWFCQGSWQR